MPFKISARQHTSDYLTHVASKVFDDIRYDPVRAAIIQKEAEAEYHEEHRLYITVNISSSDLSSDVRVTEVDEDTISILLPPEKYWEAYGNHTERPRWVDLALQLCQNSDQMEVVRYLYFNLFPLNCISSIPCNSSVPSETESRVKEPEASPLCFDLFMSGMTEYVDSRGSSCIDLRVVMLCILLKTSMARTNEENSRDLLEANRASSEGER